MEKITIPNEIVKMQREPLVAELSELRQQMAARERQISEGDAKLAEVGLNEAQIKTQTEIVKFIREEITGLQDRALDLEERLSEIASGLKKSMEQQPTESAWNDPAFRNDLSRQKAGDDRHAQ